MSEETGQESQPEVTQEASQEREYTAVEKKAMEMGWRPREEFDGEDDAFVDAKEFVGRQPFFEKISAQSKELKQLKAAVDAMAQHNNKLAQVSYEKALREVKAQMQQAVEDNDLAKYHAINEQKEALEQQKEELSVKVPEVQEPPEQFRTWLNKNTWYETQPHMRVFAEKIGDSYAREVRSGNMSPEEVLEIVEKEVKKEFPQKFRNPNKDKPSAVEGGSSKSVAKGDMESSLSPDERKIMNTLINQKGRDGKQLITKEKYLADLKAIKAKG